MNEAEEKQLRNTIYHDVLEVSIPSEYSIQSADTIVALVNSFIKNHETKERLEIMENKLD